MLNYSISNVCVMLHHFAAELNQMRWDEMKTKAKANAKEEESVRDTEQNGTGQFISFHTDWQTYVCCKQWSILCYAAIYILLALWTISFETN